MTDPVDPLALARETLAHDVKATAGPWRAVEHWFENEEGDIGHTEDSPADAEFIAHARTAAPLLAAEVVRLHEATCGNCKHWEGEGSGYSQCRNPLRFKFIGLNIAFETRGAFGCKLHEPHVEK